jgi:Mitochondrial ribosomal protein L31
LNANACGDRQLLHGPIEIPQLDPLQVVHFIHFMAASIPSSSSTSCSVRQPAFWVAFSGKANRLFIWTLLTSGRKRPWRLSPPQKARQRKRLKLVDKVVDTVSAALQRNGGVTTKAVERWYKEMPREEEMLPKDKYTIFDRKEKRYRKGIHSKQAIAFASLLEAILISDSQNYPNGLD